MASPDSSQFDPQEQSGGEVEGTFATEPAPVSSQPDAAISPTSTKRPPAENPVWNGWDVALITVLTIVIAVTLKLAADVIAQRFVFRHSSMAAVDQNPGLEILAQFLIDGAWAGLLFLFIEGKYRTPFWSAIRWNWPKANWVMLALGAVTFIVLGSLGNLLPMPKETPFDKLFKSPRDAYLLAIIAVTLGPLVEELFFRGFFYPVVARRWGVGWGVFLAALPFALLHLPQYGYAWGIVLLVFGVGVVCGVVRALTGSVAASFLVHAGYNGVQMVIAVAVTHGFTRAPKALLECFSR